MWAAIVQGIFSLVGVGVNYYTSKYAEKLNKQNLEMSLDAAKWDELSGQLSMQAAETEAAMIAMDSDFKALELEGQANQVEKEGMSYAATQRVAYVKSGVDMSGSPLLMSEETIRRSQEEGAMLRRSAENVKATGMIQSSQAQATGRARLLEGQISAAGRRNSAYLDYMGAQLNIASNRFSSTMGGASSITSSFQQASASRSAGTTRYTPMTSYSVSGSAGSTVGSGAHASGSVGNGVSGSAVIRTK